MVATAKTNRLVPFENEPPAELEILCQLNISPELELRSIIGRFEELPDTVRLAGFTRIDRRQLGDELLAALLNQQQPPSCQGDWELRLRKRRESLVGLRGKMLCCVFIRLPGVHYTIEVDLEKRAVVYWEWQHA
jgi:hypothetical protein